MCLRCFYRRPPVRGPLQVLFSIAVNYVCLCLVHRRPRTSCSHLQRVGVAHRRGSWHAFKRLKTEHLALRALPSLHPPSTTGRATLASRSFLDRIVPISRSSPTCQLLHRPNVVHRTRPHLLTNCDEPSSASHLAASTLPLSSTLACDTFSFPTQILGFPRCHATQP